MAFLQRVPLLVRRGYTHGAVLLAAAVAGQRRRFVREALALASGLAAHMDQPLPAALDALTPAAAAQPLDPATMRQIVDALTALGAGRPLGICLRRSLLRYYFLRRAGVPLVLNFGARRLDEELQGHAWLTLDGQPYYEQPENYLPYTLMWTYPTEATP